MSSSDTVMTDPPAVANVKANDDDDTTAAPSRRDDDPVVPVELESSGTNHHPDYVSEESPPPSSTTMMATQLPPPPPRRDKFASMAAAAAAVDGTGHYNTSHGHHNSNNNNSSSVSQGMTTTATATSDDLSAATDLTQQQQLKKRCLELCTQRDSVWDDCDTAEHAVTDLLKYAAQTATLLSQQTKVDAHGPARKEQLRQLIQDYQATVVQVHDLLAPHAHLVQAFHPHRHHHHRAPQQQQLPTDHHHSVYTQRVEHRLAETKRQLLQDLIALAQTDNNDNDAEVPPESSSSLHPAT